MDAALGPHMLFVNNRDAPGLIGAFAKKIGDAGINIATFHLGRRDETSDAIALVEVDQPVPDSLVAEVRALPDVVRVQSLSF